MKCGVQHSVLRGRGQDTERMYMITKLEDLERRLRGMSSCLYTVTTSQNTDVALVMDAVEYIAEMLEQQSKEIGILLSAIREDNDIE